MRVVYLSIDTPVVGWMTGAQKCMCAAGANARALMAALQYEHGESSAMRGDVAVGPVVGLCVVGFVAGVSVAWVPVVRESAQLVCL